jgi:DNA polymerase-3 subunit epsilon
VSLDLTRLWVELPWVVLDTETTGLDTKRAGVCQLAAVRFEGGREVDRFVTFCKPPGPIPAAASAVHGITDAVVEAYGPVEAYGGELARVARGALPVAYNAAFDRRMLHRFFHGPDVPAWSMGTWVDPLVIVRDVERVQEGKGYYRLETTCRRWGVEMGQAHDAGADAEATGRLLWALYDRHKVKPCSAERLLAHIALRADAHEAQRAW